MRRQVRARLASEHTRLADILAEAHRSGTSTDEAITRVVTATRHGASDWHSLLVAALLAVAATSGQRTARDLGATTTATTPTATDGEVAGLVTDYVPALARDIATTTAERLESLLRETVAQDSGASIADLASALSQRYSEWLAGRADVIGETTTVLGWEAGAYDAAANATAGSGAEITRTWNAVGDSHTRPEHAAADGQSVGLHEAFTVGGEALMYPGDPSASPGNTIGCRCTITYDLSGGDGSAADASALADAEAADEGGD